MARNGRIVVEHEFSALADYVANENGGTSTVGKKERKMNTLSYKGLSNTILRLKSQATGAYLRRGEGGYIDVGVGGEGLIQIANFGDSLRTVPTNIEVFLRGL